MLSTPAPCVKPLTPFAWPELYELSEDQPFVKIMVAPVISQPYRLNSEIRWGKRLAALRTTPWYSA
jgi:hypothetical protein